METYRSVSSTMSWTHTVSSESGTRMHVSVIKTAETVLAAIRREREGRRPAAGASAGGSDGRLIALPRDD
ncbi:hypothetical protein GCM10010347_50400 [Streptomyces cirratus]|uniref:Uncharacterized protein n=1 Tax=Streptomyces cirratus TaxID=68187 RepID=A0ABQ3EYD6_9ACTN|nr:hypothetical protein GCM10010347_50400 [Streptomyces cirratus]